MIFALFRLFRHKYGKSYLTTIGWYFLGLLVCVFLASLMRGINLLMILSGLMIGPLLYSYRSCRLKSDWFSIRTRVPDSVTAGTAFTIQLSVANTCRHTLFGLVCQQRVKRLTDKATLKTGSKSNATEDERLESGLSVSDQTNSDLADLGWQAGYLFYQLRPGEKQVQTVEGRFFLPGQYQIEATEIESRFPLGLFECRVQTGKKSLFWVYPALGRLLRPIHRFSAFNWGAAENNGRLSRQSGDFHSVALWRNGESQKRIHWRSSARRGELVVRQFQAPQTGQLLLVMDFRVVIPESLNLETDETLVATLANPDFQRRLSLGATLIHDCCVENRGAYPEGLQISLICLGRRELSCSGKNDLDFYHRAMKILSASEPIFYRTSESEPGLPLQLPQTSRNGRIIVVVPPETTLPGTLANGQSFVQVIRTDEASLKNWFCESESV